MTSTCLCLLTSAAITRLAPRPAATAQLSQVWRLVTHHLAFGNASEVLLSTLLLFNTSAVVERFWSSQKLAAFVVVAAALATVLEVIALSFRLLPSNVLPAGPFAIVFAILLQYVRAIPAVYTFRIGGVTLTNKVVNYAIAAQLFASQGVASMVPSTIGLLVGALYRSELIGTALRAYRLPASLRRLALRLSPLLGSTRSPRRSNRTQLDADAPQGSASGINFGAAALRAGLPRRGGGGAMREWTQALASTGVAGAAAPAALTADQRAHLRSMFPSANDAAVDAAWARSNGDLNRGASACSVRIG